MRKPTAFEPMHIGRDRPDLPAPVSESWWIGVSREDWPREVAKRQAALSSSHFGKTHVLVVAPRAHEQDTESRWRQARMKRVTDLERAQVAT